MRRKNNKETTFRFPFDIDTRYFLALALLFFILSIKPVNELLFSKLTPSKLSSKIEEDVTSKINHFNELILDSVLMQQVFTQTLSKEKFAVLNKVKYHMFFYANHELIFWNSVHTQSPKDTFELNKITPYQDRTGYYIALQSVIPNSRPNSQIVALFKIKNDNGIENKYFSKNFLVDDNENDYNLELSSKEVSNSKAIVINNQPIYYIYQNDVYLKVNDRSGLRLFLSALPFIFFGVSIHTYFKVESKKKNIQLIYFLLISSILIIRTTTFYFGFPNDFEHFALFSPRYFASDLINKSLGDVFINMCLLFWALLFYIINVQGKVYNLIHNKYRLLIGIGIFALCVTLSIYLCNLLYRIIRDSVINFDTTLFYKLDLFSFMGILTFMVIFVNIFCISIISYHYSTVSTFSGKYEFFGLKILAFLKSNLTKISVEKILWVPTETINSKLISLTEVFVKNAFKYPKYGYIIIAYVMFYALGFEFRDGVYYSLVFISVAVLYLMQDLNYLKTKFDFNSYKLLIWMIFISASGSFFITLLINIQERTNREEYADRLLDKEDLFFDERMNKKVSQLEHDTSFIRFLSYNAIDNKAIANYVSNMYFKSEIVDYNLSIKILEKKPTSNGSDTLMKAISFNDIENRGSKLYPSIPNRKGGFIFLEINLDKKVSVGALNHYADLLLTRYHANLLMNELYSYAIYKNGILSESKGGHIFAYKVPDNVILSNSESTFLEKGDYTELWVQNESGTDKVVMVKTNKGLFLFTTLFAYIFFIYFVTISLYILGNIIARSNLNYKRFITLLSINLRLRIHFSILTVELCSFIIIGYFTSYFLINRVNEKMESDLSKYSYAIQQEVKKSAKDIPALQANLSNAELSLQNAEIMQAISSRLRINMNVFSIDEGKLIYSSLPELYKQGLMSDRMNPKIYFDYKQGENKNFFNQESIGLLDYLSSYFLIRNERGREICMVELPFFLSNTEVRSETTTIIITLINIYIFVFLISAILAFFLTKSVTKPFTYIVKQFTKINLTKTNEQLKWFDSDEIGLLIKEYNRMLRKLENSTVQLAKREREDAWREMAKQVAHEIKNPLTPMKLSLQMLERAIKNNAANVNETAIKVTKTLVEQIDNLSIIATNFSTFAKLPVSKNEVFELNDFLYSVTGMYHDDANNEFLFMIPDFEIELFADKSQIMRVFTNIIQNAIQSIPEDRKGNIALTVSKIKDNKIRVSISDNGEGISEEKGKNLFQPYFTTKTSGTGLGLAMCKDIIEEAGGKISFESIEGEGAVFHIDLPRYIRE